MTRRSKTQELALLETLLDEAERQRCLLNDLTSKVDHVIDLIKDSMGPFNRSR